MSTRGYIVNCALESTGRQFQQYVRAASEEQAMALAAGNGVLVSSAYPAGSDTPHPVSSPTDSPEAMQRMEAAIIDMSMELRRLRGSRLLASPISTIGWGVVCGMIFWALILISVWIILFAVFALLGIAISGASRGF